jgi:HK97 family phage major capsid protein
MSTIRDKKHELQRAKAKLIADKNALRKEYKAILQKDDADQKPEDAPRLTEIENALDDHDQKIADHDERIGKCERALEMDGNEEEPADPGSTAETSFNGDGTVRRGTPASAKPTPKQGKGLKAARFAVGAMLLRMNNSRQDVANFVSATFKDDDVAKALNTTGVATGGALIPQAFSNEIIELLRAETVIRSLEPTTIEMPMGNLTIPRLAGGATAAYQGELDDIVASQETFDDIQLNAKKLTALVPVSNDLIRRAPGNIEMIVRDDMVQSLKRREDLAFMIGDGSLGTPVGLLNQCAASAKFSVLAFAALDNATVLTAVVGVLLGMRLQLVNNFSRMIRPAWIMTPTTETFLLGLRDQVGNFVYRAEMKAGTLDGYRFKVTQQLPTNLSVPAFGGGTVNQGAYLMLVDMADVIIAETMNMYIDASDVASYKDSGGNMVSAFTRDQIAFRIIEEHDFAVRHQASVCVATVPSWAPAGWTNYGGGGAFYIQAPSGDMSAAPSTWGVAAPTGSNNPGSIGANVAGGLLPGRP